jgi:hypothetical protein
MGISTQPDYYTIALVLIFFIGTLLAYILTKGLPRFSLRTLLIVTTLAAVTLGLIAYVVQK